MTDNFIEFRDYSVEVKVPALLLNKPEDSLATLDRVSRSFSAIAKRQHEYLVTALLKSYQITTELLPTNHIPESKWTYFKRQARYKIYSLKEYLKGLFRYIRTGECGCCPSEW
jgi:hypothetical protein